jgi:hypothetical protein
MSTAKRLECSPKDMDGEIHHLLDNFNEVLDIMDDEPSSVSTAVNLLTAIVQMSEELGVRPAHLKFRECYNTIHRQHI